MTRAIPVQRSQSARVAAAVGRPAGLVEGQGLAEEGQGLRVGVVLEGLLAGAPEIVQRLVGHSRPAPVVGEQRHQRFQVGDMRLVPLGDGAMERPALGVDEEVIGDLLGDDVGEEVGEVRIGRLEAGEVQARRPIELMGDRATGVRQRMDVAQDSHPEEPTDDACDLEGQLLRR